MDVDDPVRIGADKVFRHHGQIPREHDVVDTARTQLCDQLFAHLFGRGKALLFADDIFDAVPLRPPDGADTRFGSDEKGDLAEGIFLVRVDDRLEVAARTAGKNSYLFHSSVTPLPSTVLPMI